MPTNRLRYRCRRGMLASLAVCAGLAVTWAERSAAQDTAVITAPAATTVTAETVDGYRGPNRVLLSTGIAVFGLAYTPAVIVAAESPLTTDKALYAPVAGPWVNLGNRPDCGLRGASCDLELVNKVLIASDGVFQGLGVLTAAAGFLFPEHQRKVVLTTASESPVFHVIPAKIAADGYGALAIGTF
jgi:hypothetical protein